MEPLTINNLCYRWPARPVVVICADGCDPEYLECGLRDGILPNLSKLICKGMLATAHSAMPSFTNPNNVSIITGVPPSCHGISGNYFLDAETGAEVMMDDPRWLRSETILAAFAARGARVGAISAKNKLCKLLGAGRCNPTFVCFSAECAEACTIPDHGVEGIIEMVGRPQPEVYSGDLSLFVLDAGIRLLKRQRFDLLYLSLSDYIQHKHPPGSPEANHFFAQFDVRVGMLSSLDIILGIVADHGMSDKSQHDGSPQVIYLQDKLQNQFGVERTKVILPITDPYVVHHGALGGFARVYCDNLQIDQVATFIQQLPGIELTLARADACQRFSLPSDREADLVVVSKKHYVIGTQRMHHDLQALGDHRLRSHGGMSEQPVPFLISHPLTRSYADRLQQTPLNNYDIFDFAINGVL